MRPPFVFPDPRHAAATVGLVPLKREFYVETFRIEGWTTRSLQQKTDGMHYGHTALSKKPDALIRKELASLRDADRTLMRDPRWVSKSAPG